MNKSASNIIKIFLSNMFSLFSGVLVGFVLPKMMGYDDYANYKIFTLYLTYVSILTLGFGDGLYLKYTGKKLDDNDYNKLTYFTRIYYIQQLIFFGIALFISLLIMPSEYKFIAVCVSLYFVSANITGMHQNLSLITSRFNEYSIRVIIKAALTSLLVISLYLLYKFNSTEIKYQIYIIGYIAIDYILCIWYMITYKKINFSKVDKSKLDDSKYYKVLMLGMPLLLSNMAGTVFLTFDRQFVSVLFNKTDYAIYAFAYNMLSLITTMTSAFSLVLFPSLRNIQNLNKEHTFKTYYVLFSIFMCFSLIVFFPLNYVVEWILPKYNNSIEIFKIVLPGLVFSSTVSVVFINFYKIEEKMPRYLIFTLISFVISIGLNFAAYYIFENYQSISWASIISLVVWYLLTMSYFVKNYKIKPLKNIIYIMICLCGFYVISFLINIVWVSGIIYLISFCIITLLFYYKEIKTFILNQKKTKERNIL